jgi:hypothetical protein
MTPYALNINKAMFIQMRKTISIVILVAFIISSINSPAYAQVAAVDQLPWMPKPGLRIGLSPDFTPAELKGITIHPENPLMFDFIIYRGDKVLSNEQKQQEYKKLIKYFLASLAVPDEDQWVNLSPYEKNRIIKDDFGKTLMGRDLLAQDYILKQITASLIYPEEDLGKKFWNKVYAKAQQQYGTTNIFVNTFNKVWIIPDDALIYEKGNTAYVLKNHLKVMLEEDYLALQKHSGITVIPGDSTVIPASSIVIPAKAGIHKNTNTIGSQIIREIVLPALEREVNMAKNFALLRQVYSGMLLAAWFKRTLKKSILGQIYADKTKLKGVDQDPKNNEAIYQRYLRAYKKGVFNYIREDVNKYTNEAIPRKYFSGGAEAYLDFAQTVHFASPKIGDSAMEADEAFDDLAQVSMERQGHMDAAMKTNESAEEFMKRGEGSEEKQVKVYLTKDGIERLNKILVNPRLFFKGIVTKEMANEIYQMFKNNGWLTPGEDGVGFLNRDINSIEEDISKSFRIYAPYIIKALESNIVLNEDKNGKYVIGDLVVRKSGVEFVSGRTLLDEGVSRFFLPEHVITIVPIWRELPEGYVYMDSAFSSFNRDHLKSRLRQFVERIWDENGRIRIRFINGRSTDIFQSGGVQETLIWINRLLDSKWLPANAQFEVSKNGDELRIERIFDAAMSAAAHELVKDTELKNGYRLDGRLAAAYLWRLREMQSSDLRILHENVNDSVKLPLNLKKRLFIQPLGIYYPKDLSENSLNPIDIKVNFINFPEQEFINQLVLEGFTKEEAERIWDSISYTGNPKDLEYVLTSQKSFRTGMPKMVIVKSIFDKLMEKSGLTESASNVIKIAVQKVSDFQYQIKSPYRVPENLEEHLGVIKEGDELTNSLIFTGVMMMYSAQDLMDEVGENPTLRGLMQESIQAGIIPISALNYFFHDAAMITFKEAKEKLASMFQGNDLERLKGKEKDRASIANVLNPEYGGIDFNAANLNLQIKRDGNGVPLPLAQQDMAQLSNIEGLDPVILSIKPASQTPLFSQLQSSP